MKRSGYDYLIIRDGAGNELYNASGDHTGQAITSSDGTITVEIVSDGSISRYSLDFAVTCPAATTNVTFSVNTENIEVGANGIYVIGGFSVVLTLTHYLMMMVMVFGKLLLL